MGRAWTPEGKRVPIGLKVSEAKAEAVDAARGATPRAQWLAAAVDAALAAHAGRPVEVGGVRINLIADGRVPEGVVAGRGKDGPVAVRLPSPAPDPVEAVRALAEATGAVPASQLRAPQRKRCTHPGTRITGGYCQACDHLIEPGGHWRET